MRQPRKRKGLGGGRFEPLHTPEADLVLGDEAEELLGEAAEEVGTESQPPQPQDERAREDRLGVTLAEMARAMDSAETLVAQGREMMLPYSANRLAAERLVEIVAEQSKRLPETFRIAHPDVNWRSLIGMRNRFSHGYGWDIDEHLLWDAVSLEFPEVRRQLGL